MNYHPSSHMLRHHPLKYIGNKMCDFILNSVSRSRKISAVHYY